MKISRVLAALVVSFLCVLACQSVARHVDYPEARCDAVVDDYHGEEVADPYRWLEEADSPATRAWVEEENALTAGYLARIPQRERIRARLTELWNFERYELPAQEGGRVFYRKNDGLQNQSVLFVVDSAGANPRLLLDPNTLSRDGTIALASFVPSSDGKLLAYGLSDGGSDWRLWKVRDVDTGTDRSDTITRNKFGGLSWATDGTGFFYTRYDKPPPGAELQAKNAPPDVCFHRLGTDEAQDAVVVKRPVQEGRSQSFGIAEDGSALFQSVNDIASRKSELYRVPLAPSAGGWSAAGEPEPLVQGFDTRTFPIGDEPGVVWAQTDLDAPNGRIVAINPFAPGRENWRELVPERDQAIQGADWVGGKLIVQYLQDAHSVVRVFDRSGAELGEVALPGIGTAGGFNGDRDDSDTYFSFTSANQPTEIHRLDLATMKNEPFRTSPLKFSP